jgi:transcriptional regulator with XRE-family HTH domain
MPCALPPLAPGEFLKAVRLFKGWSRTELGRRAQIDATRLANFEYGFAVPTYDELHQIWASLSSEDPQ